VGVYQEIDTTIDMRINMKDPGEDFNGAIIEVPGHRTGLDRHNTRQEWTGLTLSRLMAGLLCGMRVECGTYKGARRRGPKNDDNRCAPRRPRGIQCYNCGLFGHTKGGLSTRAKEEFNPLVY